MAYLIMMDAGHGGTDPGAVYNGRNEKDDTLRLTMAVGQILENNGINVEYTRTTDIYETPFQKATEANRIGADLFISIHRNSFPTDNTAFGVESLVYNLSGLKYEIAQSIDKQLETVGFRDLGVKARPNLVVLKRTKMPAVLVEVGFLNNDTDNELFDNNFDDIANAIADGILDVLREKGLIASPRTTTDQMVGVELDEDPERIRSMSALSNMQNEAAVSAANAAPAVTNKPEHYRIQVGAFRNLHYAERLRDELVADDYPAYIDDTGEYFRVQVGEYADMNRAINLERRLKREGYQTVLVRK